LARLRQVIDDSGAHAQVEAVISELVTHALESLDRAEVRDDARAVLRQLAAAATDRVV
jgi:geranylgeranyl diphosphate synthase type I